MARPERALRIVLVGLLACSFALLCAAERAGADPYTPPVPPGGATEPPIAVSGSCPVGPAEAYEGEDDAAGEIRLLRGELAEICEVLGERTDEVSHRFWWAIAEAIAAGDQRKLTNEQLADLVEASCGDPCAVSIDTPLEVEDAATQQYSDEVVSAVNASGEANKSAQWFLIGVTVCGIVGVAIWRTGAIRG